MASRSEVELQIFKLVGYEFNLLSNKQLIKALYEDAGLPVIEKNSSGDPSTTEATLKKLAEEYELARLVLQFKMERKKSSGIKDETKKIPKPGMPQERKVLSRNNIVDELNRDPEDIINEVDQKNSENQREAIQIAIDNSSFEKSLESSESEETTNYQQNEYINSNLPTYDYVNHENDQTEQVVDENIKNDLYVDSESNESANVEYKSPSSEGSAESAISEEDNEAEKDEQGADGNSKVVSFGLSNSFNLSKDQENAHSIIKENKEEREEKVVKPVRKGYYSDDDSELEENEFSRNSATLNVKKREVADSNSEKKSKVGLYIMILVVVLALVVVGLAVNSINAIS